jgi:hypothetical protein
LTNTTAATSVQKQFSGAQHFSGTTFDNSLSSAVSVITDTRLFQGGSGANDSNFGSFTITAATNATPIQVTTNSAHGYTTGQQVVVVGATGNTGANGTFFIQNVNLTNFILIGSAGNGAYNANSGKVARAALGWLGVATQYNGAGYNILDGVDSNGHMFLNSAAPTAYSDAVLQVTGPYYQTSAAAGIPYNQLGQGGSPQTFEFSDFFLNVTSTPALNAGATQAGEYAMSVNLQINSTGTNDFGVAGYFVAQAGKAGGQNIWGLNPVVLDNGLTTTTMRSIECDVNVTRAAAAPDTGTAGFADGVAIVSGGTQHPSSAIDIGRGGGGAAANWKAGMFIQAVGYTGYSGIDPSIIYGDSTNNLVYGLNLRTAAFQANPANKISSMVAGPNNVASVVALNAAGTADLALLKLNASNRVELQNNTTGGVALIGPVAAGAISAIVPSQATDAPGNVLIQGPDSALSSTVSLVGYGGSGINVILGALARGTSSAPSAISLNDQIFSLKCMGFGATAFSSPRVRISMIAAENWSDTAQGTQVVFLTTPRTAAAMTEQVRIMDAGGLQISNAQTALPVAGDFVGGSKAAVIMTVKNSKLVFEYNNTGTVNYITIPLDGATATWTNGSTAP